MAINKLTKSGRIKWLKWLQQMIKVIESRDLEREDFISFYLFGVFFFVWFCFGFVCDTALAPEVEDFNCICF